MKKETFKTALGFGFIAVGLVLAVYFLYTLGAPKNELPSSDADASPLPVIVIDAGHGGMDGGAVGNDGTLEKELNLEIAMTLAELARICGYNPILTRTEDVMLSTPEGAGSAKMQDLKARLSISSIYPEALTVSIHCNKFPSESCKGLQVYHSNSEQAKKIADSIQASVKEQLQPDNRRQTKKADSSIYLLDRAVSPAVLIECGFLSNTEECEALSSREYQKSLALAILSGIESGKSYDTVQ